MTALPTHPRPSSGEVIPARGELPRRRRRRVLGALPGGVRRYKETLDALLGELGRRPRTIAEFIALLGEHHEAAGAAAWRGCLRMLFGLGVVRVSDGRLGASATGLWYAADPRPEALFALLHGAFAGVLETLVLARELGVLDGRRGHELLAALVGARWRTPQQSGLRRNWLLSLGATERGPWGDAITALGGELLARHEAEALSVRERLLELLAATHPPTALFEDADVAPPVSLGDNPGVGPGGEARTDARDAVPRPILALAPGAPLMPPAWSADDLDLQPEHVRARTALVLPAGVLERACAALSSGKHLLLVGPPGTGKTELAMALCEAANVEGYCTGSLVASASADWTTFETVGGYALGKDGALHFRPGVLLRALERYAWLVIDELNRADGDRALGELLTLLGGRGCDTPFVLDDGRGVKIGPEADATHGLPRTFRVIGTMNTWDKAALFQLSHALERRFALVHVDVPDDAAYGRLIAAQAARPGREPPLDGATVAQLTRLFSSAGLLAYRAIGPAIALDMVRYLRRRQAADGLGEALLCYVLPQLEGLDEESAHELAALLQAAVAAAGSTALRRELGRALAELFPGLGRFAP